MDFPNAAEETARENGQENARVDDERPRLARDHHRRSEARRRALVDRLAGPEPREAAPDLTRNDRARRSLCSGTWLSRQCAGLGVAHATFAHDRRDRLEPGR